MHPYKIQPSCAAMVSPLSTVAANIFMDLSNKSQIPITIRFRYVDDTLVIWPHRHDSLDAFLTF